MIFGNTPGFVYSSFNVLKSKAKLLKDKLTYVCKGKK